MSAGMIFLPRLSFMCKLHCEADLFGWKNQTFDQE
jgi:hypothetical protein